MSYIKSPIKPNQNCIIIPQLWNPWCDIKSKSRIKSFYSLSFVYIIHIKPFTCVKKPVGSPIYWYIPLQFITAKSRWILLVLVSSLCVCVCVLALQATVFNLELWKLEWILLLANPKFGFLDFLKKSFFWAQQHFLGPKMTIFAPQESQIMDFGPHKSQTMINRIMVVWPFRKILTWQILITHFQGRDLWPWPLNDLERSVFQCK